MRSDRRIAAVSVATAALASCAATSPVPELDAGRVRGAALRGLEPPVLSMSVTDERFVAPDEKYRSAAGVYAVAVAVLARGGVFVVPEAPKRLVIAIREPDVPYGDFSTNECVRLDGQLIEGPGVRASAFGLGCARSANLYGASMRAEVTEAFERALDAFFVELARATLPRSTAEGQL
jgi:hypothetical protein